MRPEWKFQYLLDEIWFDWERIRIEKKWAEQQRDAVWQIGTSVFWLDNKHYYYSLYLEDHCFNKGDIDNKLKTWADPHYYPLLRYTYNVISCRICFGYVFNPIGLSFKNFLILDKVLNKKYFKYWRTNRFISNSLYQTSEWQINWRRMLNQSPYHLVTNINRNLKYSRKTYLYIKEFIQLPSNYLLTPYVFNWDYPSQITKFNYNLIKGKQLDYTYDEVIEYFPQTAFKITNNQANYTVRYVNLQFLEQIYFEDWAVFYSEYGQKEEILNYTLKKNFKFWVLNQLTSKHIALFFFPQKKKVKTVLILYTNNELIKSFLFFFIKIISTWWLKSLYSKRKITFNLKYLFFNKYFWKLVRSPKNIQFLTNYFIYTSLEQSDYIFKSRKHLYIYQDMLFWILYKIKKFQLFAQNDILYLNKVYLTKEFSIYYQDLIIKHFLISLIPLSYIQKHYYLFFIIKDELKVYTKKKFFISSKNDFQNQQEIYNFIINYYLVKFKLFLYSRKNRLISWNPLYFYAYQKINWTKQKRLFVIQHIATTIWRLFDIVEGMTIPAENWEIVPSMINELTLLQVEINLAKGYFNNKGVNLFFNKLEFYNYVYLFSELYNPEKYLAKQEANNPKKIDLEARQYEYSQGRIWIRFRRFNTRYFGYVGKERHSLAFFYEKHWYGYDQFNQSLINKQSVVIRKGKVIYTRYYNFKTYFFSYINALEAFYHLQRFDYFKTLIDEHKYDYKHGLTKQKHYTGNRKYSVSFGWDNWMRCFKEIEQGKLWKRII